MTFRAKDPKMLTVSTPGVALEWGAAPIAEAA